MIELLIVRQYRQSDHDAVLKLHIDGLNQFNASVGNPALDQDLNNIQEHYLLNDGEFFVGTINEEIVAMGAYRKRDRDTAELKRIRVDREHQRKGFGQLILNALEASAKSKGYKILLLDTTSNQVPAQKLFIKNGYIEKSRKLFGELEVIFYEKNIAVREVSSLAQKFFLTDLDGTLLRSNAALSEYTIDVLSAALNKGHIISYATARSFLSSNKIVSAVPWKYPIILYNGAIVFDPVTNKVLDGHWLGKQITDEIVSIGRGKSLIPFLFALDEGDDERVLHEKLSRKGDISFYESRPNDPRFAEVTRLVCPESYRTLIITYIGLAEELEPLKSEVEKRYGDEVHIHFMKDQYIENHFFLEISHRKANKREGLKKWAGLMNCNPEDVTVFGDNLNDLGMFEIAGTKIAVSNANEKLLQLASTVVECNDEDGVAKYIERLLEGQVDSGVRKVKI
ncbi:Cof-type HAD-IIB family hydrolase [Paenibacillus alkalitolerans]|uniref:Cof-type HAD-IIB family hydrolase n=1 Tax=Paenibacillus alkalitolerans TaxID=2799335 RepID=UPI0018F58D29|nr:Cof-type HAD-IIB family hydrolase [Paenibacillus alkalitolerans]